MSSVGPSDVTKLFQFHEEEIVNVLSTTDLLKLSKDLIEHLVIDKQDYTTFTTLDHDNLNTQTTARYLLCIVVENLGRNDRNAYSGFTRVLSSKGGTCRQVATKLQQHIAKPNMPQCLLLETDIDFLFTSLITCSYKWKELGIMLGLPMHVLEECNSERSNALKLHKVFSEWLTGSYQHAELPTLENLKAALESDMVAFKNLSISLEEKYQDYMQTRNVNDASTVPPEIDTVPLQMVYQSSDTQIADHKSALLEVRVKSSEPVNYQWIRDGKPLSDDSLFSGTTGPILLIKQATLGTEGEYCCQVRCGQKQLVSTPVTFKITYSPDKDILVSLYSQYSEVPEHLWPLTTSNAYVDLALVEIKKTKNPGSILVANEIESAMIEHENIEYNDVFGKYRKGEIVLVEGRPGSGKTTLAHKIVRDWSQGKTLRNADNVFLVSLRRELTISQIFHFSYHSHSEVHRLKIEKTKGEKVCFVLDGYDEFSPKSIPSSVIQQLLHKTYLPQSMVIITSRPEAAYEIRRHATTKIEILGFTRNSFYHYIDNYPLEINNDPQIEEKQRIQFQKYVESCTNVLNICYLPINASIICFLFSQYSDIRQPPKIESKIYEMLVIGIVLNQLRSQDPKAQLHCLKDLSGPNKLIFQEICSVAFDMTIANKQTEQLPISTATLFKESIFKGLFAIDNAIKLYGIEEVFSFIHLTLQEYLAAYHLASLDDDQQLQVIIQYTWNCNMSTTLKFYCGLINYETNKAQCDALFSLIPVRNRLHLIHCAYESQQPELCKIAVRVMEGRIEIAYATLTPADFTALEYVISTVPQEITHIDIKCCRLNTVSIEYLSTQRLDTERYFDHYSNSSLTTISQLTAFHQIKQYLNVSYKIDPLLYHVEKHGANIKFISDYRANIEDFYFEGSQDDKKMRENVHLMDTSLDSSYANKFIATVCHQCTNLHILKICYNLFQVNNVHDLTIHPHTNSLEVLELHSVTMSFITTLAEVLKCSKNLKELKLLETSINREGAVALAEGLQRCTSLYRIHLNIPNLGTDGITALAKGLKKAPLQQIVLEKCKIGDKGATALADEGCLFNVETLVFFNDNIRCTHFMSNKALNKKLDGLLLVKNNLNSECVNQLIQQLRSFPLFQTLNLNFNNIGPEGAAALGKGLKHTPLCTLALMKCHITSEGIPGLVQGFYHWKILTFLDLSHNQICSKAMPVLAEGLQRLQSLTKFYIAHNDIDYRGARALATGVQHCLKLEVFNISHNNIGSIGAAALTTALKCNSIEFIDFSHNSMGPSNETLLSNLVSLAKRDHISLLDLSHNNLGTDVIMSLIIHLIFTHNPKILNISSNTYCTKEMHHLVKALSEVPITQTIYH